MAKYTSRYAELSFYVDGKERKFSGGIYVATEQEEAVLDRLVDAVKEVAAEPAETPATKPRKAGANASAK